MKEKFDKKRGEFSDNKVLEVLGEDTRDVLLKTRTKIQQSTDAENKKRKYTLKKPNAQLLFQQGYDFLQYSIVVKPYIYQKYLIKKPIELDAILYLFPIQFFTKKDFDLLPLYYFKISIDTMIELGYFEIAVQSPYKKDYIYTLTHFSIKIVKDYYAHLSGEKVLNSNSNTNPFNQKKASRADKMRENLMLKLKHQSERWSRDFKDRFF